MKTLFLSIFAISLTILTVEAKPRGKIIGGEEAPKRKKLIEYVIKIITLMRRSCNDQSVEFCVQPRNCHRT